MTTMWMTIWLQSSLITHTRRTGSSLWWMCIHTLTDMKTVSTYCTYPVFCAVIIDSIFIKLVLCRRDISSWRWFYSGHLIVCHVVADGQCVPDHLYLSNTHTHSALGIKVKTYRFMPASSSLWNEMKWKVQWFKVHLKARSRLSLTHLPVQPLSRVKSYMVR